ncbi:MAG: hypothetical protein FWE27_09970 [Defluviitaleaceae bacterium]|nr:hypothetical protein [Defluviitaleaceae bacterium]
MFRKKRKRSRQLPSLAEREAERAKKREAEREQIRADKFRLSKENNPFGQIESAKPRRRKSKIIPFPGVEVLVSKDTIYQKIEPVKNFPWLKLTITFILILIGGLSSVMFEARNANIKTEIAGKERDLRNLQHDIFVREAELRERYTFDEIERIATERLGMSFPDASQVILINVPRIGGVTLNTDEHVLPRHNYFWEDASNFLSGIFNQIFGGD